MGNNVRAVVFLPQRQAGVGASAGYFAAFIVGQWLQMIERLLRLVMGQCSVRSEETNVTGFCFQQTIDGQSVIQVSLGGLSFTLTITGVAAQNSRSDFPIVLRQSA